MSSLSAPVFTVGLLFLIPSVKTGHFTFHVSLAGGVSESPWKASSQLPCTFHSFLMLRWWLLFSRPVMSDSLGPDALQHAMASLSLTISQNLPQVHVHCIGNAIQPSNPLMPSYPSALNLSQHRRLFQWVSSSYQVTKILEFQHQSFQLVFRVDFA